MKEQNRKKKKPERPDRSVRPAQENSYLSRLIFETGITPAGPEPLAGMDYHDEIRCKDRAFSSYWYSLTDSCPASVIVESPFSRQYRTTTKRRIHRRGSQVILSSDEYSVSDAPSLLEPEFHSGIYSMLGSILNEDINRRIAGFLNFVIIRGNYESAAVIFNATVMNGETVNGFTKIAEHLKESSDSIESAFLYHDPEGSKYYLSTSSGIDGLRMKRLFGRRNLSIKTNDIIYTYNPEGFSQVNLSIAGAMLDTAGRLLSHEGGGRLLDLYCGYGFFSCFLAGNYDELTGIDYGETAIDSARENMKRTRSRCRWDFIVKRIDRKTLPAVLPGTRMPEYILLDPPRNGTSQGVIEYLASRGPELVLYIFCGLETIPYELEKFSRGGYRPAECVPLDMFPGTPDLEVMVLFEKNQYSGTRSSSKSGR